MIESSFRMALKLIVSLAKSQNLVMGHLHTQASVDKQKGASNADDALAIQV